MWGGSRDVPARGLVQPNPLSFPAGGRVSSRCWAGSSDLARITQHSLNRIQIGDEVTRRQIASTHALALIVPSRFYRALPADQMAKLIKSKEELAGLIMQEISKQPVCPLGMGVSIQAIGGVVGRRTPSHRWVISLTLTAPTSSVGSQARYASNTI
jgi:hypothetical protein